MIELKNAKYTKNGNVQISNDDLEFFAYRQLKDYKKDFFKKISPLDVDDFVEFYLNKQVVYYIFFNSNIEEIKLGSTITETGMVSIVNDKGKTESILMKKDTICIDEKACKTEERRKFTLAHEAWHAQFDLNIKNYGDMSIDDSFRDIFKAFNGYDFKSQSDWSEYHANLYAACLLMPRKFVKSLFSKYHDIILKKGKRISVTKSKITWKIISLIADDLEVSKLAVAYRLRGLNIISQKVFNSLEIKRGD